jgi:hypothetical protein
LEGEDDGVDVGADVAAVGFLVGLGWVGRLVGLGTEGLAVGVLVGGRLAEGRGVTGILVGFAAIASAALNDRSSIAKYSLVTGAGASVIGLVLDKSQRVSSDC